METQILKEIKQVRILLSKLIGTSDMPSKERLSTEALEKAAMEFKRLSIERGEWIADYDLSKIIKKAPHNCGKFIIEKFQFTNYFKHGRSLYFNRKDIVALNEELKKRNINLGHYRDLLIDQEKFNKKVEELKNQTSSSKGKHYQIPYGLKDIEKTQIKTPSEDIVINHITSLKEEFQKFKLFEYVDLYYDETYASLKFEYYFDRYINAEVKKHCKKWCFDFNYANDALKKIHKVRSEPLYR
jgi:hypothetical protein